MNLRPGAELPGTIYSAAMQVESIESPGAEWDEFVESSGCGSLGHASAWAHVLRDAYGLEPCYLAARAGGQLEGVLPMVRFRTLTGGRELVSMPFHDGGGILSRSPGATEALIDAGLSQVRNWNASALELRQVRPTAGVPTAPGDQPRINLALALADDEEAQWKGFRAKVRNQARKAEKEGLLLARGTPQELVKGFYEPFAVNMRDLGSPVHGRRLFEAAAHHFRDRLRFIVSHRDGRSVGGLVAIDFAGRVTVTWASTLRAERRNCPNNQIYWEAIRWAISRGAKVFDFGRSEPDSGTYRTKRGWGAEEEPLAWVRLKPDGSPFEPSASSDGGMLKRLSDVWTRLPVGMASWVGPRIRRRLSN